MKKLFLLYEEIHGTRYVPNNFGMTKEEHTKHLLGNHIKSSLFYIRKNFIEEYELPSLEYEGSIPLSMATFEADEDLYLREGLVIYPIIFSQAFRAYYHLGSIGMASWTNFLPEKIKQWCEEDKIKIFLSFPIEETNRQNVSSFYKSLGTNRFKKENVIISFPWKIPDSIISLAKKNTPEIVEENILTSYHQEFNTVAILKNLNNNQIYEESERPLSPTKKYISLCRRYVSNRLKVYTYLIENKLLRYGYNSMPRESTVNEDSLSKIVEEVKEKRYPSIDLDLCKEHWNKHGEGTILDVSPLKEPDRLGGPGSQIWGFNNNNSLKREYLNSYLSIITEEDPHDFPEFFMLSEKTFRPIFYKHLFILLGNQYNLQSLREKGYKTFDSLWDESYDEIADPEERANEALKQAKALILSPDLPEIYKKAAPILEHNYNLLMTRSNPGCLKEEIIRKYYDKKN
jgi:hypothetical protein